MSYPESDAAWERIFLAVESQRFDSDHPNWAGATKVHDWRNHVPAEVRTVWHSLDYHARVVVFYMAYESAMREEWD